MEHHEHHEHEHHHPHHHEHPAHVAIFIDKKEHRSPNPTTHAALYRLGKVDPATHDLYEEVHGKGDDKLIPFNEHEIHLHEHEHFFSVQKKLNPGAAWR
jgi:hypothetical protein